MTLLVLLACRHPTVDPAPALVPPDPTPLAIPPGEIRGGVYQDALYPFSIALAPGWTSISPGTAPGERVAFEDPVTGSVVRVRVRSEATVGPLPRADCDWAFTDSARYRVLPLNRPVTVATCTPHALDGPRLLGWYVGDGALAWTIEAAVPSGALLHARPAIEAMLGSVRLR